ncbi:ubiquinone biosynthesis protein [Massilia sp. TSP1-1-2]|uniref:ubiquinone biosynthesis protein n=1 Tax=Massilia sp. TSP1-1-2 TaxID=2804649 RepID=UPI003CECE2F3
MPILQLLTSFPTAVPTVLLAVLMIYWLMSIVGIVDLGDALHAHHGHLDGIDAAHGATDLPDLHSLAGYLVALGLGGVPLSVVASVLVFFTWLGTALLHNYVIVYLPLETVRMLCGVAVLLFTAALSIPIAARVIKPMRGLFVKHVARSNSSLVGLECKIVTGKVDPGFGRAEVADSGGGINIRVWASEPNGLRKNSRAIIVAYDETSRQYEVQAAPDSIH